MRKIPSFSTMKPDEILRKTPFRVPIPPPDGGFSPVYKPGLNVYALSGLQFQNFSQADFIRQYYPQSHLIMSLAHYPNMLMGASQAKARAKIHSRVAVAYQQMIKTKRKTALLGNNVGMRLITGRSKSAGENALARFREGWEEANMEIAIDRCIESDYITADCAVYIYLSNGKVGWRTFSFKDGDTLYPHYHPLTGELSLFGRLYTQENDEGELVEYLDVIDDNFFATYRNGINGWELDLEPTPHGFPYCPVAYHRAGMPAWAASQNMIDTFEVEASQFCEYNFVYGLGILFTSGAEFSIDTDNDGTPLHIDSADANAKASFLDPANGTAESSFSKSLEILDKNIMRCSFAQHTPEIKSGADMSSLTVKMLNADTYYKALEESQEYQLFLDRIAGLFKFAYGIQEGITDIFSDFKIKTYLEPFLFMSESEVINALVQLTASGVLSKRTATEIAYNSGYGTASEWDRILQEAHDELVAEQEVINMEAQRQAANAQDENPVAESREQ